MQLTAGQRRRRDMGSSLVVRGLGGRGVEIMQTFGALSTQLAGNRNRNRRWATQQKQQQQQHQWKHEWEKDNGAPEVRPQKIVADNVNRFDFYLTAHFA